jgi:SAM-dependent methyltransferase
VKHLVVAEQVSEGEVHPSGVYEGLVEVSATVARNALRQNDQFRVLNRCLCCGSERLVAAFERHSFSYRLCEACRSLFTLARPSADMVRWYLTESPAARFRRERSYRERMAGRMRDEAEYRADWLATVLRQAAGTAKHRDGAIAVVGPRSADLFDALGRVESGGEPWPLIAVGPLPPLLEDDATAIELGAATMVERLEELPPNSCVLVTLLNVVEYAADPAALIASAYEVLQPGGRLALTTRSGSGFDIQVLWERANVFPMDHINLPSVDGMKHMLRAAKFELVELSTPGLLDVQIVQRAREEHADVPLPRFLEYFFSRSDELGPERLQAFLQDNRLSSHMRVVAKKPLRTGTPATVSSPLR